MFVTRQYMTDFGIALGYLRMEIAFVGADFRSLRQVKNLSEIAGIIPASLESQLLMLNHPCKLDSIVPRYAILNCTLQGQSRKIKLAYPFQPSTPEWQTFWNELLANPLIFSTQGVGESISDSFLRRIN